MPWSMSGQIRDFGGDFFAFRDGFAGIMQAEMGEELGDWYAGEAGVETDSRVEFPVEDVAEGFVEWAMGGGEVGGPEGGGLVDAVADEPVEGVFGGVVGWGIAGVGVEAFGAAGAEEAEVAAEPGEGLLARVSAAMEKAWGS